MCHCCTYTILLYCSTIPYNVILYIFLFYLILYLIVLHYIILYHVYITLTCLIFYITLLLQFTDEGHICWNTHSRDPVSPNIGLLKKKKKKIFDLSLLT